MKTWKYIVDAWMVLILTLLMAYSLVSELLHEIAGVAMLALFITHHILNRRWFRTLPKVRYTPWRIYQTVLNVLLCAVMICLPVSGILMSKHLFRFLPSFGISSISRTVHLLLSYWGFLLMSMHLGLHMGGFVRKAGKWGIGIVLLISLYGVFAFFFRDFPEYLFLRTRFVFFDFSASRIRFFADYLTIMVLWSVIGHLLGAGLRSVRKKK